MPSNAKPHTLSISAEDQFSCLDEIFCKKKNSRKVNSVQFIAYNIFT